MEIFSKPLSPADISHRLAVPAGRLGLFDIPAGQHDRDFEATDSTGRRWSFRLVTRTGKYSKPVLAGKGWLPFVRHNELRKGDIVTFYKVNEEFKVELGPKVFGAHLYPGRR